MPFTFKLSPQYHQKKYLSCEYHLKKLISSQPKVSFCSNCSARKWSSYFIPAKLCGSERGLIQKSLKLFGASDFLRLDLHVFGLEFRMSSIFIFMINFIIDWYFITAINFISVFLALIPHSLYMMHSTW